MYGYSHWVTQAYISVQSTSTLFYRKLDEFTPRRSAVAVPPQPPPVKTELAAFSTRSSPKRTGLLSLPARPIPRRSERQSVPARSRRKLRTWEMV